MRRIILVTLLLMSWAGFGFALNAFQPKTEWISFNGSVPPALIYVTDSLGRKAGADPTLSTDANGMQGDALHGLEEIPGSVTDQENLRNDITGQPKRHTSWSIKIADAGKKVYTLNLKSVTTGSSRIDIVTGVVSNLSGTNVFHLPYIISAGDTKQFSVTYDPTNVNVSINSIVSNAGLLHDVKASCTLHLIISNRVCGRLEKIAEAIQYSLNDHRDDKAKELLKIFLHALGEPKGDRDDYKDDHNAIKEPALTALKEDVKTLLAQIEAREKHHH